MFELLNAWMPRRNNRMGTFTSMMIGATVGIAAWEISRRAMNNGRGGQTMTNRAIEQVADTVMNSIQ